MVVPRGSAVPRRRVARADARLSPFSQAWFFRAFFPIGSRLSWGGDRAGDLEHGKSLRKTGGDRTPQEAFWLSSSLQKELTSDF